MEGSGAWREFDISWQNSVIPPRCPACRILSRKEEIMPSQVAHFAINADDISRGRRFYEKVFGWKFTPYGPPGFYKIQMNCAPTALKGALQQRREIVPGVAARCFECTISVDDIDATLAAVE